MSASDNNVDTTAISNANSDLQSRFVLPPKKAKAQKEDGLRGDVRAAARMLNVSPRRIQQLVNDGVIVQKSRGSYDLREVVRQYLKHLLARFENGTSFQKSTSMQSLRALAGLAAKRGARGNKNEC